MNKLAKITTGAFLSTLLLVFTGTAFAQDPIAEPTDNARKGQRHQRGNQFMPAVDRMMRGIKHLNLSDEQRTEIKTIMQTLKADQRLLSREMRAGHEHLKELIRAETFDEPAVAELAEKEGALAAERMIISSRAMSQVYGQLTDEQRAELEIMASERAEKRVEKREKRPDRD